MHKVKYGLFFDNHTQIENPDVGRDFDVDFFTDQLKRCGVNYLGFHARCNMGLAYYDTKIGTRHPALKYDLFGELAKCCKAKGIGLVAYLNGGLSTMELVAHRDWQVQKMPGHNYWGMTTPDALAACCNSPYRAHFIGMVREIARKYPVEGFFIDCVMAFGCVCPTCTAMMHERGIDPLNQEAVFKFSADSGLSFCADIAAAVKEVIPEPMLYFNGPGDGAGRDLDTFFDCECLPTASWGYEYLPVMAHALRNITPARQVLNMTGRFYNWGDFGGLRTADALKFDLAYGLAQGMRPNIGGHVHPRGDRDLAVFDRIAEVYHSLQQYDDHYENAVNLADIAVAVSYSTEKIASNRIMQSCVRMLDELKMQFDIVFADCEKDWSRYKLLILPENMPVSDELAGRIRKHLAAGGAFFCCGENAAKAFPVECGIEYIGDSGLDPVYFKMNGSLASGLPDMFSSLYATAVNVRLNGAECESFIVKPYYNLGWAGDHPVFYAPPQETTDMPFISRKGNCFWCAGGLFGGYAKRGALHLRDIFSNVIKAAIAEPLVKVGKLPGCARMALTEQPGRLNIHLTAYAPERRIETNVVEDALAVLNGSFAVKTDGKTIKKAYLAADGTQLEIKPDGNYTEIRMPPFEGYALAVLEF